VTAGEYRGTDFRCSIREQAHGFIFLGTPHKGARLTFVGLVISLLGFWGGSSTNMLEIMKPKSKDNQNLHERFIRFMKDHPQETVCVFEAVPESIWGFPIFHVRRRAQPLNPYDAEV
jgi:hypothetical protein